jgi:hypothetical protein
LRHISRSSERLLPSPPETWNAGPQGRRFRFNQRRAQNAVRWSFSLSSLHLLLRNPSRALDSESDPIVQANTRVREEKTAPKAVASMKSAWRNAPYPTQKHSVHPAGPERSDQAVGSDQVAQSSD